MTNIHLISFGCDNFSKSKIRLYNEAKKTEWFKTITIYTPGDIDIEFKNKHKNILKYPRGNGYWIWKNYFIKKRLNEIDDNDILLFSFKVSPDSISLSFLKHFSFFIFLNFMFKSSTS